MPVCAGPLSLACWPGKKAWAQASARGSRVGASSTQADRRGGPKASCRSTRLGSPSPPRAYRCLSTPDPWVRTTRSSGTGPSSWPRQPFAKCRPNRPTWWH